MASPLLKCYGGLPGDRPIADPIQRFSYGAFVHRIAAQGLFDLGDRSRALEVAERALALSSNSPRVLIFVAQLHYEAGGLSRARELYRILLRFAPDHTDALEMVRRIDARINAPTQVP